MAKKKSKGSFLPKFNLSLNLKEETSHGILATCFFVVGFFFMLAAFDKAGIAGKNTYHGLVIVFGYGYYLIPALFFLLSISYFASHEKRFPLSRILGSILFFISGLGILSLTHEMRGGAIGSVIARPMIAYFDFYSSFMFLVGLLAISCLIIFNARPNRDHFANIINFFRTVFGKMFGARAATEVLTDEEKNMINKNTATLADKQNDKTGGKNDEMEDRVTQKEYAKSEKTKKSEEAKNGMDDITFRSLGATYTPPPLSMLERDRGKPEVGDIKANANIIKRTLQNFGITVEMDEISIGPSVTRYALKPAEGVKLSRITGLQADLALALAAHPIRIEAPIPGKSLVGIEIPNSIKTTVGLGSLLQSEDYQKSDKPLMVALGRGVSGKSYFANMARMPHLLIAGATGSGKSVTIHALINSLLFRNSPENLRFIMIDPKRVELTLYNNIPHLLTPVITDAKKAVLSLKWAAKEMDRRYDILQQSSVRDIHSYHQTVLGPALKKKEEVETMPYIVIVIDELADIMQTYPRELEAGIVRLAQMSRAVGIHLMLSTQRPSVKVITGLIKANVPARLALQVASQIDSRTILDQGGAENLLGAGDMLYLSGELPNPERIQSAFITEGEVKEVVKYLKNSFDKLPTEINITGENVTKDPVFSADNLESGLGSAMDVDEDVDDDLYEDVREEIIRTRKASTSYIQRRFKIGYGRAARLLDILEGKGVIGAGQGSKPREVLIPYEGNGGDAEDESSVGDYESTNVSQNEESEEEKVV
jgi:DNA segregation ATPase FtsK/SpoIIIE, S-DNA-T family